jgi:uncharacterized membrane protein
MEQLQTRMPLAQLVFEIAAVCALVLHIVIVFQAWWTLPDQIPAHFGITGQPDRWGSKKEIWLLPALSVVIYVGMTVLSRYAPKFNYLWEITPANAARQYQLARSLVTALKAEVIALFAIISWQSIRVAMNRAEGLGLPFTVILALTTLTIVIYLWSALRIS